MPLVVSPDFSWHDLNQWQVAAIPTILVLIFAALYILGARRVPAWPRSRTTLFLLGIAIAFVGTQSVIGVYDESYYSDHMIEHLVLIMMAAPLIAASAPLDLARSAGPAWVGRALDSRVMRAILHPLFGFGQYFVFIPLTHLTGVFNFMLAHEWAHHLEEIGFIVCGYLFFRHAFGVEGDRPIHPGLRLVYVMAAVPVDTFTGLALAMSSHNPFPAYNQNVPAGHGATWVLSNIHLGGAIMWIGGDALMLLACIPIALAWVRFENERTAILDRELDAQGL